MLALSLEGVPAPSTFNPLPSQPPRVPVFYTSSDPCFPPRKKSPLGLFPLCELRVSAFSYPFLLLSFACKFHRITFFADPRHLTLTESNSYKKQGRGVGIPAVHPTQTVPHFSTASKHPTHTNARNLFSFHALTSRFTGYAGRGIPASNTAPLFCSYSSTFHCRPSTANCLLLPCPPHPGAT